MQVVIDIPEEVYKDIQSLDWKNGERWFSEEWKAIHNGTPCETVTEFADRCRECGREKVLDKIRAEIMKLRNHNDYLDEQGVTIMEVLQIIDKYRIESENDE